MKLEEARRLKERLLIEVELPSRGVRSFRFTKRSITVTVSSNWVGQRLPRTIRDRDVYFVVEGSNAPRSRAGKS